MTSRAEAEDCGQATRDCRWHGLATRSTWTMRALFHGTLREGHNATLFLSAMTGDGVKVCGWLLETADGSLRRKVFSRRARHLEALSRVAAP